MASHTWEIDRDLALARARGDRADVTRLELELSAVRAACAHLENPEIPGRCLKCGDGTPHPGLAVCRPSLAPRKAVGA